MKLPGWLKIVGSAKANPLIVKIRWWHPGAWLAVIVAFLSGCTSLAPAPTEALIPVGVPCLTAADVPVRPDLVTDAQLLAMPDAAFVFALAKDRLDRQGYEGQLEATIQACITTAPAEAPSPATLKPPESKSWLDRLKFW